MKNIPSEIFKVLGVETRIKMIELLKAKGPLGAKSIAEELGLTPAAISQHLKILRHAGLVKSERKGFWIPYTIDEETLENCGSMLMEVCTCDCHGHYKFKRIKLNEYNLESLLKYKDEIEKELEIVRSRIDALRANKT